jgi:hypothetical protein
MLFEYWMIPRSAAQLMTLSSKSAKLMLSPLVDDVSIIPRYRVAGG